MQTGIFDHLDLLAEFFICDENVVSQLPCTFQPRAKDAKQLAVERFGQLRLSNPEIYRRRTVGPFKVITRRNTRSNEHTCVGRKYVDASKALRFGQVHHGKSERLLIGVALLQLYQVLPVFFDGKAFLRPTRLLPQTKKLSALHYSFIVQSGVCCPDGPEKKALRSERIQHTHVSQVKRH